MGLVAIVMFIDIILMVTWQLYDPLMIEQYDINKEVTFSSSSSLSQLIVGSLRQTPFPCSQWRHELYIVLSRLLSFSVDTAHPCLLRSSSSSSSSPMSCHLQSIFPDVFLISHHHVPKPHQAPLHLSVISTTWG